MLNILRWNCSLCNFNGHRIWFYEYAQTGMGFNMEPLKAKNQLEDPTINLLAFSNDDYLNVMLIWRGLCLSVLLSSVIYSHRWIAGWYWKECCSSL